MFADEVILRKGKWTTEEENYANKIISLFNQGRLPIVAGTTLRTYLSDKLRCDPMRITKKYAGTSCIGKQVFQPSMEFIHSAEEMRRCESDLQKLEELFLNRISSRSEFSEQGGEGTSPDTPRRSSGSGRSQRVREKPDMSDYVSGEYLEYDTVPKAKSRPTVEFKFSDGMEPPPGYPTMKGLTGMGKSRRIFSAPNLMGLNHDAGLGTMDGGMMAAPSDVGMRKIVMMDPASSSSSGSAFQYSMEEAGLHGADMHNKSVMSSEYWAYTTSGVVVGSNAGTRPASKRKLATCKRSHSMMALMDFEKLVADDRAAGNLFYEFVMNMQTKRAAISTDDDSTSNSSGLMHPQSHSQQQFHPYQNNHHKLAQPQPSQPQPAEQHASPEQDMSQSESKVSYEHEVHQAVLHPGIAEIGEGGADDSDDIAVLQAPVREDSNGSHDRDDPDNFF